MHIPLSSPVSHTSVCLSYIHKRDGVCEFNSIVGVLVCMCEKLCCSYVIWAIVRVYLLNTFLTGFCAGACLLS